MRMKIALLLGKLVSFLLGGSPEKLSRGGDLAIKICPQLLSLFHIQAKIIAVTGSNGKTQTTGALCHILRGDGKKVTDNARYDKTLGGVAAALLKVSNLKGEINCDFIVLEVDPQFAGSVFYNFRPDLLVITNLFRENPGRTGNLDIILDNLSKTLNQDIRLLLNANDPLCASLAQDSPRVFFSLAGSKYSSGTARSITHDGKICPLCSGALEYKFFHFGHVGEFGCTKCSYKTPAGDYKARNPDFDSGEVIINNQKLAMPFKNLVQVQNITAAVAAATEAGVPLESAAALISSFQLEDFPERSIGGRTVVALNAKTRSPASYDLSMDYIAGLKGENTVVIHADNATHTDTQDTTWLYDTTFEKLIVCSPRIVCCGRRAYDVAVRLKLVGFDMQRVSVAAEIAGLGDTVRDTPGALLLLADTAGCDAMLEVIC